MNSELFAVAQLARSIPYWLNNAAQRADGQQYLAERLLALAKQATDAVHNAAVGSPEAQQAEIAP